MTRLTLIRKYAGKVPAREIARIAGCGETTVRNAAKRHGIDLTVQRTQRYSPRINFLALRQTREPAKRRKAPLDVFLRRET